MTPKHFHFDFQGYSFTGEFRAFPIDGSTELHVTPHDGGLFESFGVRILSLMSDGSISAAVPAPPEERDYVFALADGLANYFNHNQEGTG